MRTYIKAAVTLAAFGASLAVAAPAQAAAHVLSCNSGYNTIICELSAPPTASCGP
jgi:hypothetical protein